MRKYILTFLIAAAPLSNVVKANTENLEVDVLINDLTGNIPVSTYEQDMNYIAKDTAIIRTLDKVTGKYETVQIPINQSYNLGNLVVNVKACYKKPPEETPEDAAFLIVENFASDTTEQTEIFKGWMFSSSPSLSPFEHPVYDIWVIGCK
jgi:hypothetical protein